MNVDDFNRTAKILGKKYVPALLKELTKKNWVKANDVASYIGITTATAVNYLHNLAEIGLLEKRKIDGLTGEVWVYRLGTQKYSMELNIEDK